MTAGPDATANSAAFAAGAAPKRRVPISLFRRSKRRGLTEIPGRADIWALSAVLLGYPDDEFYNMAPELDEAITALPDSAPARRLAKFWTQFKAQTPMEARKHYVETFDLRRKCSLFLSYYLHGDTRQRGMALLTLKQRYRAYGFTPQENELPDYLPMVLEFAAYTGTGAGEGLLRTHRNGIELIAKALDARKTFYTEILKAVTDILGPVTDRQMETINELARTGPPTDTAGLDSPLAPYGAPLPGGPNVPFGPPEVTCSSKG